MSNKLYIRNPFFLITLTGIVFSIYNFIKGRKAKIITISILLLLQCILSVVFVVLYVNITSMTAIITKPIVIIQTIGLVV